MTPPYDEAEIVIGYGKHLALVVDDLDAALERAAEAGVTRPARCSRAGTGSSACSSPTPTGT